MEPNTQKLRRSEPVKMTLPAARKSVEKSKSIAGEHINVGKSPKGEKIYDTAQAAAYLKCSRGHVRKLVSDGKLEAREKVGKHRTFTQAALDEYKNVRRRVGRPIGSGTITRSEEERRWWREYMRGRRGGKPTARSSKSAGKKSKKRLAARPASKKAGTKKGAGSKAAAGRKKKPAAKSSKR
jgi:excisionase family DNA binding protein